MIRYKAAALVFGAGALCSLRTAALGIGEIRLESYLNEPLRASISLLDTGGIDERQLRIRLASRDDFDRVGAERAYFLTSLTFEVELDEEGGGRVVVTSNEPVLEPYLNFLIEARWPDGRLLREFTVLLDPPTYTPAVIGGGASGRAIAQEPEPEPQSSATTPREVPASEPLQLPGVQTESQAATTPVIDRPFAKDTVAQPAGGERYLIRSGETLWSIASSIQGDPRRVRDTMLDIQRRNPDAFIDGNINQVKAGFIIYLPRPDEVGQAPDAAVVADLQRQNAAARERGSDAPSVTDAALRIAPTDDAEPAAAEPAAQPVVTAAGSAEQASPALDDVSERLAALESRMSDLVQLIELKDQQIAALQESLADKDRQLERAAVASAPPSSTPAAPATVPVSPPSAEAATPFWMERLPLIGVGVGIILLALLGAMRWRRKQQKVETGRRKTDRRFDGVTLGGAGVVVGRADAGTINMTTVAETASELASHKPQEQAFNPDVSAADALAEADIYIAYGRYPQAKDLLRRAISTEPLDAPLRLKLLEVCAETLDQGEFCQQYADLLALGDSDAVAQASRIAESFADGEAWCAELPPTSLSEEQLSEVERSRVDAAPAWQPEVDAQDDLHDLATLEENPFLRRLDDEPNGQEGETTEQPAETRRAVSDVSLEELDLSSLGLSDTSDDAGTAESAPSLEQGSAKELERYGVADDLPLELDLSADLGEPLEDRFNDLSIEDEQDTFDLDLNLDPLAELETNPDDLDDSEEIIQTKTTPATELSEPDGAPPAELLAAAESPSSAADDAVDDEPIFAVGGDEAAAKLDLARAFIDIGEQEGARQLLQEVLSEGSPDHQAEAESLLEKLT